MKGDIMIDSLRSFINFAAKEDWILKIRDKVHLEDLPELIQRLIDRDKILIFENIESYPCKVVTNLVPSHRVLAVLLGEEESPYKAFLEASRKKGRKIPSPDKGEYITVDTKNKDIREILPILRHYQTDTAPFITTGIVSAKDPETGITARGIHRMGWRGKNKFGIALLNPPLRDVFYKYASEGIPMPISISIGVDPLFFLAMALKVPGETDKLEVAAGIKGHDLEVMASFESDIDVPKGVEYLLEGLVLPGELEEDGTLGEISGYSLTFGKTPTAVIERLSHRPQPLYHALLPTSPEADSYLTFVSRAHIGNDMKKLYPFILDMHLVRKTFGSSSIIRISPADRESIRSLIVFGLSFPMIKKIVVVDEDVDIYDPNEVEWAIITRCRAEEDLILLQGLRGQPIDPTFEKGFGVTKIGINATKQGKGIQERAIVCRGNKTNIENIMKSLGD